MLHGDWMVECREGTCFDPRLPWLREVPFRMRRLCQPTRVFVIDNRREGERFTQGNSDVELISIWTALDLLAGAPPDEPAPCQAGPAEGPLVGELRSQNAVADSLGIGRTRLSALIKALPPERYGAATLISSPTAAKKRCVWHEDALDDWLDAAVEACAAAKDTPAEPTGRKTRTAPRRSSPRASAASSFKALVRGE